MLLFYCVSFIGASLCLYADGHAVFHLRHRWDAVVRVPPDGPNNLHREAQQL